jgi:hypothetical protein
MRGLDSPVIMKAATHSELCQAKQGTTHNTSHTMDQTIENGKNGGYSVYEFGEYPESSVLAGQTRKRFVDNFDTIEEAQACYPSAELGYRDAHNYFDHL